MGVVNRPHPIFILGLVGGDIHERVWPAVLARMRM